MTRPQQHLLKFADGQGVIRSGQRSRRPEDEERPLWRTDIRRAWTPTRHQTNAALQVHEERCRCSCEGWGWVGWGGIQ